MFAQTIDVSAIVVITKNRPSQKTKKLSDQKYLLTTFIGSHETLKNGN